MLRRSIVATWRTLNVVFLSPHFPPNFHRFCVGLREVGATVLGIGDTPFEELRPELCDALRDCYRVDDLHRYDDLVRAMGWLTHRHGKIDRIDSLNEYWLATEAALRTDFDIAGVTSALIAAGRVRLIAADGIDHQSWADHGKPIAERARRHGDFDRYVAEELQPFIGEMTGRDGVWATGCSMGAYHAANAFFRHPDLEWAWWRRMLPYFLEQLEVC